MSQRLSCANGHAWEVPDGQWHDPSERPACPVCGEETETAFVADVSDTAEETDVLPPPPKASPRLARKKTPDRAPREGSKDKPVEIASVEALIEQITQIGLMSADDVRRFTDALPAERTPHDSEQFAQELVRENKLTPFQARVLVERSADPLVLGQHVILDAIGAGGMGKVYKAEHCGMKRTVALKVLPPQLSRHPQAIERFRREVSAAAQLEHDHIVTVYEAGEHDGQHFFSMQLVDGLSLAELVQDGPLANRRAAGYLVSVARAVEEAHEHGILHRDIKPQNVLVDAKTNRALVADFGLAKLTDERVEVTRSGEMMGTPPYMSPEQARDTSAVTAATDVYALGATLYRVLAGRPPFQAASVVETLRQVAEEEPVSPRRLNPAIDRDLETIALKCLEKEPSRRYSSAGLLADELQRYLNGEPIQARPVGPLARSWRWARRNRPLAIAASLAVFFLIGTLAATSIGWATTSIAKRKADAATWESDASLRDAQDVVDFFFTRFGENALLNQPGTQPFIEQCHRKALEHYQRFLVRRGSDARLRQEAALVRFRLAHSARLVKPAKEAYALYLQARDALLDVLPDVAKPAKHRAALSNAYNGMGEMSFSMGQLEQAKIAFENCLGLRRELTESEASAEWRRKLANAYMNLAIVQHYLNESLPAGKNFESAQQMRQTLLDEQPDALRVQRDLAKGYYNWGTLWMAESARDGLPATTNEARRLLRQAADGFRDLKEKIPGDFENQYSYIACQRCLGDLERQASQPEEAWGPYNLGLETAELLARWNPDVDKYHGELALLLGYVGELQVTEREQPTQGMAKLRRAKKILEALVAKHTGHPRYQSGLKWVDDAIQRASNPPPKAARSKAAAVTAWQR